MAASLKQSLENMKTDNMLSTNTQLKSTLAPAMLMKTATEPELTVDMDARTIMVPDELKTIGVVLDNNAETIYIRIPSTTFDDISLTDKTAYVEFINAGGQFYAYKVRDNTVEGDTIKLGWTIGDNVTAYAGTVRFQLTFELGNNYKWSTLPASFDVLGGLNVDRTISPTETTLITSLISRANEAVRLSNNNSEDLDNVNNIIAQMQTRIAELQSKIEYLENNVMYIFTDID